MPSGRIAPRTTAFGRRARNGLVVIEVVTEAQQVSAELPFGIDAGLVARIAGVLTIDGAEVGKRGRDVARARVTFPSPLVRAAGRASTMTGQPVAGTSRSPL